MTVKEKPYPAPIAQRGGCKVSWNYYTNRKDADACARAAIHNARIALSEGYDFGYCAPGTVERLTKDKAIGCTGEREQVALAGWFEVCIP